MVNFKVCTRKQRNDGFWPVYIRVTHNRKVGYIKTEKIVPTSSIGKNGEIYDPVVMNYCSLKMVRYVEILNRVNTELMSVNEVIDYVKNDDQDICFSEYARKYRAKMIDEGRERSSRDYANAYQHLERFAGTNNVMFSQLTTNFLNRWIESMSDTHRVKEKYPICVRQIYRAAIKELNDYDKGLVRIKLNPWLKVDIPRSDVSDKLAITPDDCRAFFSAPIPDSNYKYPLPELGRDVAMMVFCLAGMNTVDIWKIQKSDYYDGVIHYKRSKTQKTRRDDAYFEIQVPSILQPILEKYKTDEDDPFLFSFHKRHSTYDSFCANVNRGIKIMCESIGMKRADGYSVYTFRHTWATIASNDCDATLSDVGFAMNHVVSSVTRGYVKIDFSPAWKLNDKVIDFVFFSDKKGKRQEVQENTNFERFSFKYLMRGTVYFRGRQLGQIQDIGFNNVDEIIDKLLAMVPDDLPDRCIVQIKIENLDKKQTQLYERQKGKSF